MRLNVLVDYDTLRAGLHPNSVCELSDGTSLPVSLVRQMAAEADIIPIVLNGNGQALDVGRTQRLATPAQRDALRAMYTSCVDPDCDTPFDECHVHHVDEFADGGNTDLANLLPVCKTHGCHTKYHEGGWTLEIDDTPPDHDHPTRRHHPLPRTQHQPSPQRRRRLTTDLTPPQQALDAGDDERRVKVAAAFARTRQWPRDPDCSALD